MPRRIINKASGTQDGQLHEYELVLIISPEVVEERFDAIIAGVSQFITGNGGTVSNVERWGKRRLAYPIEHFTEGSYTLTHFRSKPALNKKLEANLEISEEVLRHLLIKTE